MLLFKFLSNLLRRLSFKKTALTAGAGIAAIYTATPMFTSDFDKFANFVRTLALPEQVAHGSLTSLREKLVRIGARLVHHSRYAIFQMAEVAVSRDLFEQILDNIADLRCRGPSPC